MVSCRFLQFSDLHLGRNLEGSLLNLSAEQERQIRSDRIATLENIVELAIAESVDLVLVPGDLFEEDRVSKDEIRQARQLFEELESVPVMIAPGNHDSYSVLSWYEKNRMTQNNLEPWPDNVHIFENGEFESIRLPSLDGVRVTGMAYKENRAINRRMLEEPVVTKNEPLEILLFHGSLESASQEGKLKTLPFSRTELLQQEISYAAIGHYHGHQEISGEAHGFIKGAYAGSPMGVTLNDDGERTVVLGELEEEGVPAGSFDKRRVCPRLIHNVEVEFEPEMTAKAFRNKIQDHLEECGVADNDLVRIQVTGVRPEDTMLESEPIESLEEPYFHFEFDLRKSRPPIDVEQYLDDDSLSRTTEGRFVRKMHEYIEGASAEEEKRIARLALRLGIEAFRDTEIDLSREISER